MGLLKPSEEYQETYAFGREITVSTRKRSKANMRQFRSVPAAKAPNGKKCGYCAYIIPQGEFYVVLNGLAACQECKDRSKICVTCGKLFVSKVNNKKNCDFPCEIAWSRRRAIERKANPPIGRGTGRVSPRGIE